MRRICLIFIITLAVIGLFGCPKAAKPEIKPAGKEKAAGAKPQFNSLLGEVFIGTVGGVDLTGLPKKLYYPGAKPLARYGKYERARWGCSYNFETSDPADKVWRYFTNLLSDWKQAEDVQHERFTRRSFIGYVDGVDKEVVDITVSPQENKTVIVIAHTYNEL
ncbi:MAG: hypothetical protein K6T77_00640 [candidate division WOR-3 bacterium]|jgi:hypothetical protein|nr:hypothetical protein [candidate division WOR-3 bacterium]MCR4424267.1 hypothetical protein [candidate division WOR-3 bacterium]MDH7519753.1 hypothetical protein [bacterium]